MLNFDFKLFVRIILSNPRFLFVQKKGSNETDDEYFERVRFYDKFPGLIFEDECTRFVVCIECGIVTKNIPSTHHCERQVEFLRDKPVEVIKRMHKSSHLTKYFKQKADKVI